MGETVITLTDGRRFEVARVASYELEEGHVVVFDDDDNLRVRTVETIFSPGLVIFEGEDRIREAPMYPMILMRQL